MIRSSKAAMILAFDIEPQAEIEHDEWHSHEHLPERLAIAGFLRGSRWTALSGEPKYFVMYEALDLAVLDSPAYLQRLNDPSPWTARMMPAYRGMKRGLCRLAASFGHGLGGFGLLVRITSAANQGLALREHMITEVLPALPGKLGLVSAQLFESGLQARSTTEQRIRGKDAGLDSVILVTGYAQAHVAGIAEDTLSAAALGHHGAIGVATTLYQLAHCLTHEEIDHAGSA